MQTVEEKFHLSDEFIPRSAIEERRVFSRRGRKKDGRKEGEGEGWRDEISAGKEIFILRKLVENASLSTS